MLNSIRRKIVEWLLPELIEEHVGLMRSFEAMHDILVLGIPYTEGTYQQSLNNVIEFEQIARDVASGDLPSIADRGQSLIEVLRRSEGL
jgi:hypothetical protein